MIFGDKIRLRAVEKEDLPNFAKWLNDRQVTKYLNMHSPLSNAAEEKWFDQLQESNSGEALSIDARVDNNWLHIGICSLNNIDMLSKNAEFGIFIGNKDYWNKGYSREATLLTLKHGFEDLNLHRIYLHVFEEHEKAIAVYQAAGFQHEGLLRDVLYKNGSYHNFIVMSILRSDWDKTKHKDS